MEAITREEQFMAAAAGQAVETPEPITRREKFLKAIADADKSGTTPAVKLVFIEPSDRKIFLQTFTEGMDFTTPPPSIDAEEICREIFTGECNYIFSVSNNAASVAMCSWIPPELRDQLPSDVPAYHLLLTRVGASGGTSNTRAAYIAELDITPDKWTDTFYDFTVTAQTPKEY